MSVWIKGTPPKGTRRFWAYSRLDGVYICTKGLGSDDWLTSEGRAWQTPEYWMPFIPPKPPK